MKAVQIHKYGRSNELIKKTNYSNEKLIKKGGYYAIYNENFNSQ
jgi:hypothetical protein